MIAKNRKRHLHMGCGEPLKALSGLNEHKSHADSRKSSEGMKQARKRTSGNGVG